MTDGKGEIYSAHPSLETGNTAYCTMQGCKGRYQDGSGGRGWEQWHSLSAQFLGKECTGKVSGLGVTIVNGSEIQVHLWLLVLLLEKCTHVQNGSE